MKWRDLLTGYADALEWYPPASEATIDSAEAALHVQLPPSLKSFLRESNGVEHPASYSYLVWSAERIVSENLRMRSDPLLTDDRMTLDSLLFFTTPGVDGIHFAFPISVRRRVGEKIFAWYPIEDSRPCIAWSFESYLTRWLSGDLKI